MDEIPSTKGEGDEVDLTIEESLECLANLEWLKEIVRKCLKDNDDDREQHL